MGQSTPQPAGWYTDPTFGTFDRWWDGSQWTGATRPRAATAPPLPVEAKKPTSTSFARGCVWFVVSAFLLAFVGCMALVSSGSDDDDFDEFEAEYYCEEFVKDRLKSPSSADFQRPTRTADGVDTWTISGTVDADNSFGAAVRMRYVCTVRGAGDEVRLVDLDLVE